MSEGALLGSPCAGRRPQAVPSRRAGRQGETRSCSPGGRRLVLRNRPLQLCLSQGSVQGQPLLNYKDEDSGVLNAQPIPRAGFSLLQTTPPTPPPPRPAHLGTETLGSWNHCVWADQHSRSTVGQTQVTFLLWVGLVPLSDFSRPVKEDRLQDSAPLEAGICCHPLSYLLVREIAKLQNLQKPKTGKFDT